MPNCSPILARPRRPLTGRSEIQCLPAKSLDGPQALALFLARWQELYFKALHVRAMDAR